MIAALMQPYFFPYLGYFQLVDAADEWIAYDDVQYSSGGWINRNRILHPNEGWQYVNVRLRKHRLGTEIRAVELSDRVGCRDRVLRQLEHYKRKAPCYEDTLELVGRCFDVDSDLVADLDIHALELCCRRLGIETPILRSSDVERAAVDDAQSAVIGICRARGATTYVNAPGGRELYDDGAFRDAGMALRYLEPELAPYEQGGRDFVPGLSIIDVFMWNPVDTIRSSLMRYRLGAAQAEAGDA